MMMVEPKQDYIYEVDYTYNGQEGLRERWQRCRKNHAGFIPIKTFAQQNLPSGFQTEEMINLIKRIARLTVRVRCSYTSMIRRKTAPETDQPYVGADSRGCSGIRVGTGVVTDVMVSEEMETPPDDLNLCPCYACQHSGCPELFWGKVTIVTAAHVVCAPDEIVHTEIDCFYDSEDKDAISVLYGNSMRASRAGPISAMNYFDDFCQFCVITHDIDLCRKLKEFNIYDLATSDLGVESAVKSSLTVIVSHPHGLPKCVSIGEWVAYETLNKPGDPDKYKYHYNTATCPGSSGALVWLLDTDRHKSQKLYIHSAQIESLNVSGTVDIFSEFIKRQVQCRVS